ncbi:MAG TPA: hypothetical protein DEA05_00795 [Rhodobacteraceae bacterium]|nr:hypothetical protein [Paracoccaceae bacterium]
MSRPVLTRVLLALWGVTCLASLGYLFLVEPTGDGFTRGLNRITGFLGWQIVAGVLAVLTWWAGRGLPKRGALRWLSRLPGLWALLLVAAIAGLILWARLSIQPPPPSPGPATEPATPARPLE